MSQRVNIQYSIDIEDLPQEASRLLGIAFTKLRDITTDTTDDIINNKNILSLNTAESLGTLRTSLADIDYMLEDVTNIINGYVTFKSQPSPSPPSPGAPPPMDDNEFTEKLKEFKELIGKDENPD